MVSDKNNTLLSEKLSGRLEDDLLSIIKKVSLDVDSLTWYHVDEKTGKLVRGSNSNYVSYVRFDEVLNILTNAGLYIDL